MVVYATWMGRQGSGVLDVFSGSKTIILWGSISHPNPERTVRVDYPDSPGLGCELLPHKAKLDERTGWNNYMRLF